MFSSHRSEEITAELQLLFDPSQPKQQNPTGKTDTYQFKFNESVQHNPNNEPEQEQHWSNIERL